MLFSCTIARDSKQEAQRFKNWAWEFKHLQPLLVQVKSAAQHSYSGQKIVIQVTLKFEVVYRCSHSTPDEVNRDCTLTINTITGILLPSIFFITIYFIRIWSLKFGKFW